MSNRMERSASNRGKKVEHQSKKQHKTNATDYMNYIPEAILFHMLSFLPLRDLIIMSLVSNQWKATIMRYLKIVPSSVNLKECEMPGAILKRDQLGLFCGNLATSCYPLQQHYSLIRATRKYFTEFLDRCFQLHSGGIINNLQLSFIYEADAEYGYIEKIDSWVHFIFTNDVKELSLDFSETKLSKPLAQPYDLPCGYFAPRIMKALILNFCKFRPSSFLCFKSLKMISLVQVEIFDGTLAELASKSPMLKEVNLERCVFPNGFMTSKKDIMVERLSIINCRTQTHTWRMYDIKLSTPCLLMLKIMVNNLMTAHIRKATKLLDVTIGTEEIYRNQLQEDALISLLISVEHCRSLTIDNLCIQVLPAEYNFPGTVPTYLNNLKRLDLLVGLEKRDLSGICHLLWISPNLESLTLQMLGAKREEFQEEIPQVNDFEERIYWDAPYSDFHCLNNSLKNVIIAGFSGSNNEMKLLRFLLRKARVLQKMEVISVSTDPTMEQIQYLLERLAYFPRASAQAIIC